MKLFWEEKYKEKQVQDSGIRVHNLVVVMVEEGELRIKVVKIQSEEGQEEVVLCKSRTNVSWRQVVISCHKEAVLIALEILHEFRVRGMIDTFLLVLQFYGSHDSMYGVASTKHFYIHKQFFVASSLFQAQDPVKYSDNLIPIIRSGDSPFGPVSLQKPPSAVSLLGPLNAVSMQKC